MNKFNYLSFSLIFISFIFTIYELFFDSRKLEYDDYYPEKKDKSFINKIIWYLSQLTYQKQILVLLYFFLKIRNYSKIDTFLKIIAPIVIVINILFFKYIFPNYKKDCEKENYKLYELRYIDLFPHFLDTIIIILELWTLKDYKYSDIFLPIYVEIFMFVSVILNYKLRKTWTYTFLNLKEKKTYLLIIEFIIYTHLISYISYKIKK